MWDNDEVIRFLESRARMHVEAAGRDDVELPPCTDEERWKRPTEYAVMSEKRKTPLATFAREDLARENVDLEPGRYLETIEGESIRCSRYCSVASWCDVGRRIRGEE
jgi:hypothetical protein